MLQLNCSKPGNLLGWLLFGAAPVVLLQTLAVWSHAEGNWLWLLHVSKEKPLRPQIERELGPAGPYVPYGHDGEMFYVIARDPWGREGTPALLQSFDDAQYRYRRILYPLLAGGFGMFSPSMTLGGMILLTWFGAGLTAAGMADVCYQLPLPRWVVLVGLLNPGVLISAGILTSDVLALGLSVSAIALWGRGVRWPALLCLCAALLTRETHALIAVSLAAWSWQHGRRRDAVLLIAVPIAVLGSWSGWLWLRFPHGAFQAHNFAYPGSGLFHAVPAWFDPSLGTNAADIVLGAASGVFLIGSIVLLYVSQNSMYRWCSLPWIGLTLLLSIDVWGRPNNAFRVLAPLWIFTAVNLGIVLTRKMTASCSTEAESSSR